MSTSSGILRTASWLFSTSSIRTMSPLWWHARSVAWRLSGSAYRRSSPALGPGRRSRRSSKRQASRLTTGVGWISSLGGSSTVSYTYRVDFIQLSLIVRVIMVYELSDDAFGNPSLVVCWTLLWSFILLLLIMKKIVATIICLSFLTLYFNSWAEFLSFLWL